MVPGDGLVLTQLRRGVLEYCVLAMLQGGRLYGLDIARRLATDQVLMSSEGTLYPLLARLRKAGQVRTTWQESTEGPPRRYYEITGPGMEALDTFRVAWVPFKDAVDAALTDGAT